MSRNVDNNFQEYMRSQGERREREVRRVDSTFIEGKERKARKKKNNQKGRK